MSRVVDGTTLGGFRCDAAGCDRKATHSPMLCVPYERSPPWDNPLIGMVDTHVCMEHWRDIRIDDVISKPMKDVMEDTAALYHGRPDFRRMYLAFIPVHSWEYTQFLQKAGLVYPDDAVLQTKGVY